jgi:3-hydroxyacyl-[acyl-carrier-protein] dehydratase
MQCIDINKILKMLPHRFPFILVDRVIDYRPLDHLTAIKNVTINEPFFTGHFPENPIMPGVLMLEALAQASGILSYLSRPEETNSDLIYYFAGIKNAKFRHIVTPGDQLHLKVKFISSKQDFWRVQAEAYVDEKLACSAELLSAVKEIKK